MIHHIEIETIRHCNARCVFCPQSLDPLPADTMSLELFEHICKEIKNIGPLHNDFFVTLNHYGEPLLDKFFEERIKLLDKYKLHVVLHTNGTKLDYSKTKFLHDYRHLFRIIDLNIVTLDEKKWCDIYQLPSSQYVKTIKNLFNFLVVFELVQKGDKPKSGEADDNIYIRLDNRIKEQIKLILPNIDKYEWGEGWKNSRAGLLKSTNENKDFILFTEENKDSYIMHGCRKKVFIENFSINYKGDIFLCCQDYYQTSIVGNITKNNISSIMNSPNANNFRDQMYGKIPADKNLICRKCIHSMF